MEETIFIQGREGDPYLKHVIESTYLSNVIVVLTKLSQTEIRENPKGLSLGWGQFGAKASFSKMGVGVFKVRRKEVWGSNAFPFSTRHFLLNGIGVSQMRERLCGIK